MPPTSRRILQYLLSLLLVALVCGLACSHRFYIESIVSAYFAAALAGAAIIYACIRRPKELIHVVAVALVLWALEYGIAGTRAAGIFLVVPTISLVGLAAFLVLGLRAIWSQGDEQRMLLYAFIPAVIFAGSDWFASELLAITEKLHPQVFDYYLFSFDASLIWQASPEMGKIFATYTWFRISSTIVYVGLALPIALVYGLNLRRRGGAALPVMYAFLLTGPIGVIFYNLLPAMGPAHVFGASFPFYVPDFTQAARLVPTVVTLPGPRNAIPSLHMGWVLLAWWNSKGLHWFWRAIVLYFVLFTVCATLGTGEHYLVDLIVAYPFALLLQAISKTSLPIADRQRWVPLVASVATILLWFALLRFDNHVFWLSPSIGWLMSLVTIAGAIGLHYWLQMDPTQIAGEQPALSSAVAE
ncbi:hypothetical protein Acid345_0578 [Candidatus Koribacter versatilis Ellin345]|uniref:Inositolphosphotransferase Aur1/Ipt1 domain-containing protein n=1 Tax=Koribacter versatilis (strain Ellin345) TaxID=204669 RepID=Q1IU67_KORVE|nr:phosphatase PAP2 family protein [Candidatus Koribacter versatilis]ABF39583.1 hypothetical protein Acid345_0578 [Candidatus Koribacter versatilis Ellin345]